MGDHSCQPLVIAFAPRSFPQPSTTMSGVKPTTPDMSGDYIIEFDRDAAYRYSCCLTCVCLPLATSCLCLPCVVCVPYCQRKEVNSQKCKVTNTRVEFETGWMNHVSKNVPLDRIQDVSVSQGCCQRCFGVKGVGIQTAGSGEVLAEVYLVAPKNAEMVRDEIMRRRDLVVLGHNGRPTAAIEDSVQRVAFSQVVPVHTTLSITSDEAVLLELRELKEALLRIEKHVEEGVDKML